MNVSSSRPARRAFTLVEILVVIGIIALLAAVLFPVFSRARENARKVQCMSNMKQLGVAFAQYRQDFAGRFPGSGQYQEWANGGHWIAGPINDTNTTAVSKLAYIGGDGGAQGAPTGHSALVDKGALFPYVKSAAPYVCPSVPNGSSKGVTYSMSCALAGMSDVRVKEATNIVLLVDEQKTNDGMFFTGSGTTDELTKIHNGGGNLLFVDGHSKFFPFDTLPLDGSPAGIANKVLNTPGKVRFRDLAFGGGLTDPPANPTGAPPVVAGPIADYFISAKFGSCRVPDVP